VSFIVLPASVAGIVTIVSWLLRRDLSVSGFVATLVVVARSFAHAFVYATTLVLVIFLVGFAANDVTATQVQAGLPAFAGRLPEIAQIELFTLAFLWAFIGAGMVMAVAPQAAAGGEPRGRRGTKIPTYDFSRLAPAVRRYMNDDDRCYKDVMHALEEACFLEGITFCWGRPFDGSQGDYTRLYTPEVEARIARIARRIAERKHEAACDAATASA
jgi:hypothetical protein